VVVVYLVVFLSIHTEYRWDTKFTVCLFWFSHGSLCQDFTNQREIWYEASPISQTGFLKFWGWYPKDGKIVALFYGTIWRDMHFANALVYSFFTNTHTHNHFTALWILSGTTWVSRYQKKQSSNHTYCGHQSSFICFIHLLRSMASSLFNWRAWQSFFTISKFSLVYLLA